MLYIRPRRTNSLHVPTKSPAKIPAAPLKIPQGAYVILAAVHPQLDLAKANLVLVRYVVYCVRYPGGDMRRNEHRVHLSHISI